MKDFCKFCFSIVTYELHTDDARGGGDRSGGDHGGGGARGGDHNDGDEALGKLGPRTADVLDCMAVVREQSQWLSSLEDNGGRADDGDAGGRDGGGDDFRRCPFSA